MILTLLSSQVFLHPAARAFGEDLERARRYLMWQDRGARVNRVVLVEGARIMSADVSTSDGVVLSDTAASKVKALLEQEGRDDLRLRIAVQPGGCSGLRYQLYFDDRSLEGDILKSFGGVEVVTDKMSSPYLMGATIDFVDTIEKQGFTIDNPNAGGSCACGDSFH